MEIYLDNSATTRVFPEVAELMNKVMCGDYGNPSSMHIKGIDAEKYVKDAKEVFSGLLKCEAKNIYFTSGGTESDNLAIIGTAHSLQRRGRHLITTQIEHPAVLNTMKYLESEGFEVTYLPVNEYGVLELSELEKALRKDTILVSVMHTNNEIGSVQPIQRIGETVKDFDPEIVFHVDAVQGFGKAVIRPKKQKIDLLSISSHKIHGPKGMGVLYVGDGVRLKPISFGGGQQGGLRNGTENVPGIAGMALAAKMLDESFDEDTDRLFSLKEKLIKGALRLEGVSVNGIPGVKTGSDSQAGEAFTENLSGEDIRMSSPHIVSLSFSGVRAEVLLHTLEDAGIYVSAGSACSTHKPEPSATLKAIGLDKSLLDSTLRFSMSHFTTEEEIDETLRVLGERLPVLRKFVRM
ncbi:MAG: cysteine desulfurase [Lachnospiraceae bacterium]|nr:cysteine desulfurase [Lachnospiraceae bacterium]